MAVYLVSYDTQRENNYPGLEARLERFSRWARPLRSQWLVESDETAYDIAGELKKYIDRDDRLLVSQVTAAVSWYNLQIGDEAMLQWQDSVRR